MSTQFKFFHISACNQDEAENDLNSFLRGHRVLTVHREFVADRESSFWSFVVEYLDGAAQSIRSLSGNSAKKRIDYKEVLSPEDFAVFARLREWRKQAAGEAGVPVYTIFTNEQLARIVTGRIGSKTALRGIEGVGESRVEKYGDTILRFMHELTDNHSEQE